MTGGVSVSLVPQNAPCVLFAARHASATTVRGVLSSDPCHVTCDPCPVTCDLSPVTCDLSLVTPFPVPASLVTSSPTTLSSVTLSLSLFNGSCHSLSCHLFPVASSPVTLLQGGDPLLSPLFLSPLCHPLSHHRSPRGAPSPPVIPSPAPPLLSPSDLSHFSLVLPVTSLSLVPRTSKMSWPP